MILAKLNVIKIHNNSNIFIYKLLQKITYDKIAHIFETYSRNLIFLAICTFLTC